MEQNNLNPKQALIERLQQSKNILVTVSNNPSVDQLAACLGLTIWLNRADKHATAVFSGEVPSTLEFLQPAETLEKNTDSLRDFIISLDKSKADKLRYKVEENVVKIFITPYRTSLSADDLEYSQGDFNVDTVVALGVSNQSDLDAAITSHGRILHDATVATITTGETGTELGSIQWHDPHASSLSELVVELGNAVDQTKLDNQVATALLTGIVAQTERFSNDKTTPQTMSISAILMSAGANQQLVASKLEEAASKPEPQEEPAAAFEEPPKNDDGSLEIEHEDEPAQEEKAENEDFSLPEPTEPAESTEPAEPVETHDDVTEQTDDGPQITDVKRNGSAEEPLPYGIEDAPELVDDLKIGADPSDETVAPSPDGMGEPANQTPAADTPLMSHDAPAAEEPTPPAEPLQPAPSDWMPPQPPSEQSEPAEEASTTFTPDSNDTLSEIEQAVESPHIAEAVAEQEAARPDLDEARDEVMKAIQDSPEPPAPTPVAALNAQPIDLNTPVETAAEPAPEPAASEHPQTLAELEQSLAEPTPAPSEPAPAPVPSTAFDPNNFAIAGDPEPILPPVSDPVTDPNQPAQPELTGSVAQPFTMPLPPAMTPPINPVPPTSVVADPSAPPPVPPPLPFGQQR